MSFLQASYAYVERKKLSNKFKLGEGIVGQCAFEKKSILLTDVPDNYIKISSGLGEEKPRIIIAIPVIFEDEILGVYEFASFKPFSEEQKNVLNEISKNLGIIINNVKSHQKTEILLKESQKMAEELQEQQEELRAANEELEEKTKILRESEEELKAQSEELQAANEELEEKTERLQQRNQDIDKKNKEIEKSREEIEQRSRDLALASKYKSEFLANMSHELRTPLNSLLILSKNLSLNKKGNLDEKQIESAEVIHKGGQELLRLINDILDLSKVEAGKLHIEIDTMDVQLFCDEMKIQFKPLVENNKVNFQIDIASDVPKSIKTDQQRLSQIIKNLLSNAFKFTKQGGIRLEIIL